MTLGLVVPDASNPFFAELGRAVEEAAFDAGYTLLVGNSTENETRQTSYVRTFIQRQVDGLLVVPAHGSISCLAELRNSGTPWVLLDRHIDDGGAVPEVLVDNRGGARAATEHLLSHGRRRILCLAGPADLAPATERVGGWAEALRQAGLRAPKKSVWHAPFGRQAGYQVATKMLAAKNADAVFVTSDEQALGVLRAVRDLGLSCPDDVAIASFDGILGTAYATPALTTMAQPFGDIGRESLTRLLAEMGGAEPEVRQSVLPVTLIRRGSCGCPDVFGDETPGPATAISSV